MLLYWLGWTHCSFVDIQFSQISYFSEEASCIVAIMMSVSLPAVHPCDCARPCSTIHWILTSSHLGWMEIWTAFGHLNIWYYSRWHSFLKSTFLCFCSSCSSADPVLTLSSLYGILSLFPSQESRTGTAAVYRALQWIRSWGILSLWLFNQLSSP